MFFNRFKGSKLLLLGVVALMLWGCGGKDFLYHENIAVADEVWTTDNILQFPFSVADTNTAYRVGLNIRYTLNFPKQNLYVFVHTAFPNGTQTCDTVSIDLFAKDGTPYGKGKRIKELDIPVAKLRFPMSGQYKVYLEQGMRTNALEGIASMGFYVMKPTQR